MLRLSTFIFLLLLTLTGNAQIIKWYKSYPAPNIVLVKLPTYTNRLHIYEKAKNVKAAEQIKKDAVNMQRVMIADFKNNFSYCDYYYFYDTASEAISAGHFEGNLYDKDLKQVTSSPIAAGDTTYQLIQFGYYISESSEVTSNPRNVKSRENTYYTGSGRQRLIVLNYKFGRLPDPLPNGTIYSRSPSITPRQKKNKRIKTAQYSSKKFDIYYTPSASVLSSDMDRYYKQRKVN